MNKIFKHNFLILILNAHKIDHQNCKQVHRFLFLDDIIDDWPSVTSYFSAVLSILCAHNILLNLIYHGLLAINDFHFVFLF